MRRRPYWLASAGLDPTRSAHIHSAEQRAPHFYGRTAISRTLFEADAAHINFENNTDDLSCESYIADTTRTIITF
jgi:hypothetical protein